MVIRAIRGLNFCFQVKRRHGGAHEGRDGRSEELFVVGCRLSEGGGRNLPFMGGMVEPEFQDRNHESHESHEMRMGWDATSLPQSGESGRVRKCLIIRGYSWLFVQFVV